MKPIEIVGIIIVFLLFVFLLGFLTKKKKDCQVTDWIPEGSCTNLNQNFKREIINPGNQPCPELKKKDLCVKKGERYFIKNSENERCIYTADGKTHSWECWNNPTMKFELIENGGDYQLKNLSTDRCLAGEVPNSNLLAYQKCNLDNYYLNYELLPSANDKLKLKHRESGKCMYVDKDDMRYSPRLGECTKDPDQYFEIYPQSDAQNY